MDTVDALRDQRERHEKWTQALRDQNARLRSDNERMREALDHVSALCPESKQPPHPHPDQPATFDDGVWMGKLVAARIARSALSQGQGEG